jgi:hypothetical protein
MEAIVQQDGGLALKDLPFKEGEHVEVIVLESSPKKAPKLHWKDLAGSVLRYDDPTKPVAVEDWDALK